MADSQTSADSQQQHSGRGARRGVGRGEDERGRERGRGRGYGRGYSRGRGRGRDRGEPHNNDTTRSGYSEQDGTVNQGNGSERVRVDVDGQQSFRQHRYQHRQRQNAAQHEQPQTHSHQWQKSALRIPDPSRTLDALSVSDDMGDASQCLICTDQVQFYSIGICNHRVCHVCSLRLRSLYQSQQCPMCKCTQNDVVFTSDPEKQFENFMPLSDLPHRDAPLSIYCDSLDAYQNAMSLLQFNCPHPECDFVQISGGWDALKRHVRQEHQLMLCDICLRHKRIFSHQHTLYPPGTIEKHNAGGDIRLITSNRGLINPDESFVKGHPECGFCKLRFFASDDLYAHCRDRHEECFLCQRRGVHNVYFKNYDTMERHFRDDHFICQFTDCLERKFVVFDTEIDLRAHEQEIHKVKPTAIKLSNSSIIDDEPHRFGSERGRGRMTIGRGQPKENRNNNNSTSVNRTVQSTSSVNNQSTTTQSHQNNNNNNNNSNNNNSNNNSSHNGNQSPSLNRSTAQQGDRNSETEARMRRIRGAPPGFGSTTPTAVDLTPPPTTSTPSTELSRNSITTSAAPIRHQLIAPEVISGSPLISRIAPLLNNRADKLDEFRHLSTNFTDGSITADDYVSIVCALCGGYERFGRSGVVNMLIDSCPIKEKQQDLLRAFREQRIKNASLIEEIEQIKPRTLVIKSSSPSGRRHQQRLNSGPSTRAGWQNIIPRTANKAGNVWSPVPTTEQWPSSIVPASSIRTTGANSPNIVHGESLSNVAYPSLAAANASSSLVASSSSSNRPSSSLGMANTTETNVPGLNSWAAPRGAFQPIGHYPSLANTGRTTSTRSPNVGSKGGSSSNRGNNELNRQMQATNIRDQGNGSDNDNSGSKKKGKQLLFRMGF